MANVTPDSRGIYCLKRVGGLLGAVKLVLPDAVPACSPACTPTTSFGYVGGALSAPQRGDRYLVEFLSEGKIRVLAYVDRFARVFSTDVALSAPPAREPDLQFLSYSGKSEPGVTSGYVQVRDATGAMRQVARYRCVKDRYTLFDSWYDFGEQGRDLAYDVALARCYFAFVYRPQLCGAPVPARGLDVLYRHLKDEKPLAALRAIVRDVQAAQADPALQPPALARCLAEWLEEAGLPAAADAEKHHASDEEAFAAGLFAGFMVVGSGVLGAEGREPLRLVKTARYANTYYLGVDDADAVPSRRTIWGLEAALNRFLLVGGELGERAATATDADCGRWDASVIEAIARQAADATCPADEGGQAAGEWELRVHIGQAMENLRLPVRFAAELRVDVAGGVVAFDVTAPDASLMPARRWDDVAAQWVAATPDEQAAQALRYAEHLGIALAAAAFQGSSAISTVVVTARPLGVEEGELPGVARQNVSPVEGGQEGRAYLMADASNDARTSGEFPAERALPFYQVTFSREAFCRDEAFRNAALTDPAGFFAGFEATFGHEAALVPPFAATSHGPRAQARRDLPEVGMEVLSSAAQQALGARTTYDLRISYDAALRRTGEGVAEAVVRTESATEAIHAVRATQDSTDDPLVFEACTRLMTALAEGTVDAGDLNALVSSFLGDDVYATALMRARAAALKDPAEAVALLSDAIARAEASLRYVDNAETVHRMFDSYVSRVVYNRGREAGPDAGKRVELVPTTLALCYLESAKLLEESFAHADDALRYGKRCIEMAPTFSVAYRQTARAYMLMGDMESAADTLKRGLAVALHPEEIAIAYYQMAYVEWKAGRLDAGVACYLKSIMTSPVYGAQATVELQELLHESGARMVSRDEVDDVLAAAGIPVAPCETLLDQLDEAMCAATDAGVFAVARPLLSLRLHYRPDDALVNVLSSLADSAIQ